MAQSYSKSSSELVIPVPFGTYVLECIEAEPKKDKWLFTMKVTSGKFEARQLVLPLMDGNNEEAQKSNQDKLSFLLRSALGKAPTKDMGEKAITTAVVGKRFVIDTFQKKTLRDKKPYMAWNVQVERSVSLNS